MGAVKDEPHSQNIFAGLQKTRMPRPTTGSVWWVYNATKLYHKVEGDEKVWYYEFTSLYPAVNAKKQYPVGHSQIYRNFDSLDNYFGFVKCTVLPPRGLYHPVLPCRCHGKLMFLLCCACVRVEPDK